MQLLATGRFNMRKTSNLLQLLCRAGLIQVGTAQSLTHVNASYVTIHAVYDKASVVHAVVSTAWPSKDLILKTILSQTLKRAQTNFCCRLKVVQIWTTV